MGLVKLGRGDVNPLKVANGITELLPQLSALATAIAQEKQRSDGAYGKAFDTLITYLAGIITDGGLAGAQAIIAMTALISADPTRMLARPKREAVRATDYSSGPWGDWDRTVDDSITPWQTEVEAFLLTFRQVWPQITKTRIPKQVDDIAERLGQPKQPFYEKYDATTTDPVSNDPVDENDGQSQSAGNDAPDPHNSGPNNGTSNPTSPTPSNPNANNPITTGGPPTTNPLPHDVGITNVQPAQQRYVGGVKPIATGPRRGGDGDGFGITDGWYDETKKQADNDPTDENRNRFKDQGNSNPSGTGSGNGGDDQGSGKGESQGQTFNAGLGAGSDPRSNGGTWYINADTGEKTFKPNDPNPDDDTGGESRPSIPYGPRHNNVTPNIPSDPRSPANVRRRFLERMLLERLGAYGYASGDDLASGGYNPHFDPDPDAASGGAPSGSGSVDPTTGSANDGGPSLSSADFSNIAGASPTGPDPDNEWGAGGYNPHYQPSNYTWTPFSRGVGGTTRVAPARAQVARAIRLK